MCSPCTNSGVKTTLKGATFVVESRTYAQIFVAKWSPTDKKKEKGEEKEKGEREKKGEKK